MLICNNVSIVLAWGVFQPIIHTQIDANYSFSILDMYFVSTLTETKFFQYCLQNVVREIGELKNENQNKAGRPKIIRIVSGKCSKSTSHYIL